MKTKSDNQNECLSDNELTELQSFFDNELLGSRASDMQRQLKISNEAKNQFERLRLVRQGIKNWYGTSFVNDTGAPYKASLWDAIESKLDVIDQEKLVKATSLQMGLARHLASLKDFFTFCPRQWALAGSIAVGAAVLVVVYGLSTNGAGPGQNITVANVSEDTSISSNAPDTLTFVGSEGMTIGNQRAIQSRLYAERAKSFSGSDIGEIHTASLDVDWILSDKNVSFLNTGSKNTPPVIWVANKELK